MKALIHRYAPTDTKQPHSMAGDKGDQDIVDFCYPSPSPPHCSTTLRFVWECLLDESFNWLGYVWWVRILSRATTKTWQMEQLSVIKRSPSEMRFVFHLIFSQRFPWVTCDLLRLLSRLLTWLGSPTCGTIAIQISAGVVWVLSTVLLSNWHGRRRREWALRRPRTRTGKQLGVRLWYICLDCTRPWT